MYLVEFYVIKLLFLYSAKDMIMLYFHVENFMKLRFGYNINVVYFIWLLITNVKYNFVSVTWSCIVTFFNKYTRSLLVIVWNECR